MFWSIEKDLIGSKQHMLLTYFVWFSLTFITIYGWNINGYKNTVWSQLVIECVTWPCGFMIVTASASVCHWVCWFVKKYSYNKTCFQFMAYTWFYPQKQLPYSGKFSWGKFFAGKNFRERSKSEIWRKIFLRIWRIRFATPINHVSYACNVPY